jgi:hypothetical protein
MLFEKLVCYWLIGIGFKKYSACTEVGSHPFLCDEGSKSVFAKYGVGIILYFKQFKYLMLLTFIVSLIAIPGFVLFIMSNKRLNSR